MKILISLSGITSPKLRLAESRVSRLTNAIKLAKLQLRNAKNANAAFVLHKRIIDYADKLVIAKDKLKTLKRELASPTKSRGSYDPTTMKGAKAFAEINGSSKLPPKVEGYWRQSLKEKSDLPFPIVYKPTGYNKTEFLAKLEKVQERANTQSYRGWSSNRWTGESNGSREFEYKGWKWPEGLITYLKAGVPPSQAFYKLITGKALDSLPTYNR